MKVAILFCGQLRDIDFCIDSIKENLLPSFPNCDVYVCTQDCNSIKPRIDTSPFVNQYVFVPITYDIEKKIMEYFGKQLQFLEVRKTYDKYISDQTHDLMLKTSIGWMENFKDYNICYDAAIANQEKNGFKYDLFIKTRPDIIYCDTFRIEHVLNKTLYTYDKNDRFIWDAVFGMDPNCAKELRMFYTFYSEYAQAYMKHLKDWKKEYNTEDFLYMFCKINNINVEDIGDIGYPLSWLVGDIKNNSLPPSNINFPKRYLKLSRDWQKKIIMYSHQCKTVTFDIKIT